MVHCPGCGVELQSTGEVEFSGQVLAVYQCDTCVRKVRFIKEYFNMALTFALDADGNLIDPDTLETFTLPPREPGQN